MRRNDCYNRYRFHIRTLNSVVSLGAKAKPEESPWMEVVALSGTGWWPRGLFHKVGERKLGFLSHSESYKKSILKKGVTLVDFMNISHSNSVQTCEARAAYWIKYVVLAWIVYFIHQIQNLCLCPKTMSPHWLPNLCGDSHLTNTSDWLWNMLLYFIFNSL